MKTYDIECIPLNIVGVRVRMKIFQRNFEPSPSSSRADMSSSFLSVALLVIVDDVFCFSCFSIRILVAIMNERPIENITCCYIAIGSFGKDTLGFRLSVYCLFTRPDLYCRTVTIHIYNGHEKSHLAQYIRHVLCMRQISREKSYSLWCL